MSRPPRVSRFTHPIRGRSRHDVACNWQTGVCVARRGQIYLMHLVSFTDAYKEWRNRARKYNLESIVNGAIDVLAEASSDAVEELQKAPWLTMLMVKWACQDRYPGRRIYRRFLRSSFTTCGRDYGSFRSVWIWAFTMRCHLNYS